MLIFEQIEAIKEDIDQYIDKSKELNSNDNDDIFYKRFAIPKTLDHFIGLVECLYMLDRNKETHKNYKRDRLTSILADCVYNYDNSLSDLLYATIDHSSLDQNSNVINHNQLLRSKLVNILVSLPELISNIYGHDCPAKFTVKTYIIRLCSILNRTLCHVHAKSKSSFYLAHINLVIGRLFVKGHSQLIWDNLLKNILNVSLIKDPKWLKIIRQILFNSDEDHYFDQTIFIEPLLKIIFANSFYTCINEVFNYEYLHSALNGKGINLLKKIEFLLTNKFLLIFHCSPSFSKSVNIDPFLFNIFTYLYTNNRTWLYNAINNLLDTWSNLNGFKHRLYYQHFYLARQIIICTKLLFQYDSDKTIHEMWNKFHKTIILSGKIHLQSSQAEFRVIGLTTIMIVLDILSKYSGIEVETPKFEEVESSNIDECQFLKKLSIVDLNNIFNASSNNDDFMNNFNHSTTSQHSENNIQLIDTKPSKKEKIVQLDSDDDDDEDDDLQPFDLSHDVLVEDDIRFVGNDIETSNKAIQAVNIQTALLIDNSRQAPIYIQDCIDGLVQIEKPLWAEKCLHSAERIIRANFDFDYFEKYSSQNSPLSYGQLNTIALKFVEVLFHLDNQVGIKNFEKHRLNALIALTVGAPKIVAKYLSDQFYAPYLSIQNRLDALNVLRSASEELSKPLELKSKTVSNEPSLKLSKSAIQFQRKYFNITYSADGDQDSDDCDIEDDLNKKSNWQAIVSERIRSNTRYISSLGNFDSSNNSSLTTSRFVPVASYFFFPLLRDFNRVQIQLNLHEEDSYVLEQLFYSLGLLLQNCANYPQANLMAKELLQLISSFRNHQLG